MSKKMKEVVPMSKKISYRSASCDRARGCRGRPECMAPSVIFADGGIDASCATSTAMCSFELHELSRTAPS